VAPQAHASFIQAGLDDVAEIAEASGGEPAAIRRRLVSGRWCFLGRVQGTPAASGWVSFGTEEIGEQGLRASLAPGEAYVWDCVTAPAFRRRGLYTALLRHIVGALRAENLCRAWIGSDAANEPSLKGLARAGFRQVLTLYTFTRDGQHHYKLAAQPGVPPGLLAEAQRVLLGEGPT
jgi:ribosomal protein S18 acetylase RimI-like enzyme